MNIYGLFSEIDKLYKHFEIYGMDESSYKTLCSLVEQFNIESGKKIMAVPSFEEAQYIMDKQYLYDYS